MSTIKNSTTTGTHPLYYAIAGSDVVEILNSSDMRERRDETYLFPNIKEI